MDKTQHYKKADGTDLIDRWAKDKTPREFRAGIGMIIEKYISRLGKKDKTSILDDVRKICDYAQRWYEYENNLLLQMGDYSVECLCCEQSFARCEIPEDATSCPSCRTKWGEK